MNVCHENVLITGATGCGKSSLANALGYQACQRGYKVGYFALPKLLQKLHLATADGSYAKELSRLEKLHLLILDDWGLPSLYSVPRKLNSFLSNNRVGMVLFIFPVVLDNSKYSGDEFVANRIDYGHFVFAFAHFS